MVHIAFYEQLKAEHSFYSFCIEQQFCGMNLLYVYNGYLNFNNATLNND